MIVCVLPCIFRKINVTITKCDFTALKNNEVILGFRSNYI